MIVTQIIYCFDVLGKFGILVQLMHVIHFLLMLLKLLLHVWFCCNFFSGFRLLCHFKK